MLYTDRFGILCSHLGWLSMGWVRIPQRLPFLRSLISRFTKLIAQKNKSPQESRFSVPVSRIPLWIWLPDHIKSILKTHYTINTLRCLPLLLLSLYNGHIIAPSHAMWLQSIIRFKENCELCVSWGGSGDSICERAKSRLVQRNNNCYNNNNNWVRKQCTHLTLDSVCFWTWLSSYLEMLFSIGVSAFKTRQ